jgi:hypothetical protein
MGRNVSTKPVIYLMGRIHCELIAMNRLIAAISIFVFITLIPFFSWAKVAVNLKLDRSQVQLVDSVELTVSVSGSRDSDSMPDIRGLENFDVRSGGTSSRIEFINGKMSSGVDYTYFIQPQKIGTFQIGPARVLINAKAYSSNTAKLQVVKPAGGQGAGADSPIFLTAEFSDDTVYVEEQTIYTLKLFLRRNVRNINLNLPETENLIFKQISKPVEYRSTRNGQNYQVIEVQYAVVPSKAGSYAVDPSKMSMTVLQSRRNSARSFFDDPFSSFSSGRPLSVASKSLLLTVRPLPREGKPPDFSGLVGKFQVWSKLEPVSLKTGESATLTVSVSGQGNVNRIPDLKIPELTHIKIYADKPVLESTQDSEGTRGSKTMKWALVPEKEGRLEVPPVAVSYFDTQNHRYKTLTSSKYTLSVLPGKKETVKISEPNAAVALDDGAGKQTIREIGRDIFPVHSAMQNFKTANRFELENWVFRALLGLPVLLYLGTLGGMTLRRRSRAGQPEIMAKKAAREFYRHYRKGRLSAGSLLQLIRDYLNRRFGLSYGSVTSQESVKILISHGVGADTAEALQNIMLQLENAEYTGQGMAAGAIDRDLVPLIKQIEKQSR